MRAMEKELLNEIDQFLAASGMKASYFGKAACGNSELIARLRDGKTVTLATVSRIRAFIAEREAKSERAA